MAFLDEQGVGPCGHMAKEKGILIKVFASCLANEIPAELAFSTHSVKNDKNTGLIFTDINRLRGDEIHDGQHPSILDFSQVRCKNTVDQPCTMAPGSTWERWCAQERILTIQGKVNSEPVWCYLWIVDDDSTIKKFAKQTQGEDAGLFTLDMNDYGVTLGSGWGEEPPEDTQKWMEKEYFIDYRHQ